MGWLTEALLFAVLLCLVLHWLGNKRDNSDAKRRSGLIVRTDALTGCQYLETILGGVTPRLDKDGKQICVPTDNLRR